MRNKLHPPKNPNISYKNKRTLLIQLNDYTIELSKSKFLLFQGDKLIINNTLCDIRYNKETKNLIFQYDKNKKVILTYKDEEMIEFLKEATFDHRLKNSCETCVLDSLLSFVLTIILFPTFMALFLYADAKLLHTGLHPVFIIILAFIAYSYTLELLKDHFS